MRAAPTCTAPSHGCCPSVPQGRGQASAPSGTLTASPCPHPVKGSPVLGAIIGPFIIPGSGALYAAAVVSISKIPGTE